MDVTVRDDERCKEQVGERPHYLHWHTCDRPAKYVVRKGAHERVACGVHVGWFRNRGYDVEPKP